MSRLFLLLLTIVMGTMAGIGVIIVLVLGHFGTVPIIGAAAAGAVLSIPLTWIIARKIKTNDPSVEE